jgi:molecular chaperone HscB
MPNDFSRLCWSCSVQVEPGSIFCAQCNIIQPPLDDNHFIRLALPIMFDINLNELDKNYFQLQAILHPDKLKNKTVKEQALSLQHSILLNEAYNILKSPLKRAEYLLELNNIKVKEESNIKANSLLLLEAMEKREALAECETINDLEFIENSTLHDKDKAFSNFKKLFEENEFDKAVSEIIKIRYIERLLQEVKNKKMQVKKS